MKYNFLLNKSNFYEQTSQLGASDSVTDSSVISNPVDNLDNNYYFIGFLLVIIKFNIIFEIYINKFEIN